MKRSSTSSDVHESCEKQPAAKRGWGLGSLLHGLAGYVRPKNNDGKERSETETLSRDIRDYRSANCTSLATNQLFPDLNETEHDVTNVRAATRNETVYLPKYESTLSRSSTFSHTQPQADSGAQQQKTPMLPRFKRESRPR